MLGAVACRPPGKFLISDLLRLFLVLFWGETARVGQSTAKSSHSVLKSLRWDVSHSAEVNNNINLGYSQDKGFS